MGRCAAAREEAAEERSEDANSIASLAVLSDWNLSRRQSWNKDNRRLPLLPLPHSLSFPCSQSVLCQGRLYPNYPHELERAAPTPLLFLK